ncbi:hypothetical protein DPMN_023036 [Dreissena polymorpha]|uniref:Uncharacterized protein n=1 Tax=Dreissena polymorpha TaxID=45954 RepID=A0A9D4RBE0_DREPO|nr:hypothetical protein DPMN_023036 [Dreissena polymorpha]
MWPLQPPGECGLYSPLVNVASTAPGECGLYSPPPGECGLYSPLVNVASTVLSLI